MPQDNSDFLSFDNKLDQLHFLIINCGVGRFLFFFFLWNQGIFFKKYFIFDTDTAGEVAVKNITTKRHMALKCFGM